jgi:hypothetical protein
VFVVCLTIGFMHHIGGPGESTETLLLVEDSLLDGDRSRWGHARQKAPKITLKDKKNLKVYHTARKLVSCKQESAVMDRGQAGRRTVFETYLWAGGNHEDRKVYAGRQRTGS